MLLVNQTWLSTALVAYSCPRKALFFVVTVAAHIMSTEPAAATSAMPIGTWTRCPGSTSTKPPLPSGADIIPCSPPPTPAAFKSFLVKRLRSACCWRSWSSSAAAIIAIAVVVAPPPHLSSPWKAACRTLPPLKRPSQSFSYTVAPAGSPLTSGRSLYRSGGYCSRSSSGTPTTGAPLTALPPTPALSLLLYRWPTT
eukprot:SM000787S22527  [mRNA]  locus=s787:1617:2207:+ [translate_table: standard]